MVTSIPVLALAAVFSAGARTSAGQGGDEQPLTVHAVRFFRPASATTTIEGVCELRLASMAGGAVPALRYRFEVAVIDSGGLELNRSGWNREVPGAVTRVRGAKAIETFSFAAAPGRYRVRVRATPEGGAAAIEREIEISTFGARPALSDLLLATAARRLASDTDAVAPDEVRLAGMAMRTAPVPSLSMTEASLTYYAEVYPWPGAAADGELRVEVLGAGGRRIVQAAPRAVRFEPAGGLTRGSLDLAGLPEGGYRLRIQVRLGDSTVTAEAPFAVSFAQAASAADSAAAVAAADAFATMGEERLDSLYAPLVTLIEDRERGVFQRLATLDAKRRFMREFWQRRDPTPTTPDNPAMAEFYRAVGYVNEAFREGGSGQIPGWRTDRGRIYLRNGRPDEALRRPLGSPRAYEVWRFTRDRDRYYVFVDQSGFGHYVLIGTNDRREVGFPDWEATLGQEGSQDVARFLRQ